MSSAAQIAANLDTIRRLWRGQPFSSKTCRKAGRNREEVTILGASKNQPLERLRWAWEAGLRVFGENRVQEGLTKMPQLPDEIEWHLLGPLQSNKVKKVVGSFSVVHSIDRLKIARALDREAGNLDLQIDGFLEVNLAAESSKHGFLPGTLTSHLGEIISLEHLRIIGLMAIPPFEVDPQAARVWFRQLRELGDRVHSADGWDAYPGMLSMGMSHDYAVAIEEGATHVRIGTALFGERMT